ncbi:MAG: ABC transporter permease subunit [Candidatus Eremiobacteraeota bacterium]|nr:ABC transporter permease subunit [Candidatus Eremiobacteraeota bacterium]
MTLMRAALVALLLLVAAPLVNLFFMVPAAELASSLADPAIAGALRTSLIASLGSVGLAALLGIPAGYVLARGHGAPRAAALFVLALPLALPPVASGIALLGLLGTRESVGAFFAAHGFPVVDSLLGVAVADFFVSGSVIAIAATAAFAQVDRTLEEAARTLGAGTGRVLLTVALPLAAPSIAAGTLLAWLRALGEYGATSIVAYHPTSLPIALVVALSADGVPRALALAEAFVGLAAFVALIAALAQRRLT